MHTHTHTQIYSHANRRERHDIPLIVQTCVDEVERRGMSEVGVYRVVGVLRDVQELRQAFDTGREEQCTVASPPCYSFRPLPQAIPPGHSPRPFP